MFGRVFMFNDRITELIKASVRKAMEDALHSTEETLGANKKIVELRKDIVKLEIERDRIVEERERRDREIEHKIGLERKRQESEIEIARRETTVKVREENLGAAEARFKKDMEFMTDRMKGEVEALRSMVGKMMERLPSAEMFADFTPGRKGRK